MILETPRIILRKLTDEDMDDLYKLYSKPEIMQYITGKPRTLEETKIRLQRNIAQYEKFGFGLYATILRETGAFIGRCGIEPVVKSGNVEGDLAWMFFPDYWNQGLATEIGKALILYGQNDLDLHRIFATAHVDNKASIRVMQKLNLKFVKEENKRVEYEV